MPSRIPEEALRFDNLWQEAYFRLSKDCPELLTAFQNGILEDARNKCQDGRGAQLQEAPTPGTPFLAFRKQLELVMTIELEYIEEKQLVLKFGHKEVKVRETIRGIVQAIQDANGLITTIASNEPHAALVWAGISCCLPFILNAMGQDDEAIDGLNYLIDLVLRYQAVHASVAQGTEDDAPVRASLRAHMIEMYFRSLEYQLALLEHHSKGKVKKVFRNIFAANDWKDKHEALMATEATCNSYLNILWTTSRRKLADDLRAQSTRVDHLVSLAEEEKFAREDRELDEWLGTHALQAEKDHKLFRGKVSTQYRDSGQWFVEHVKLWLLEEESTILWGHGHPGAGKTILMSSAIQDLSGCLDDFDLDQLGYVYFQWDKKSKQTLLATLATILRQLRTSSLALTKALLEIQKRSREDQVPPEPSDFERILRDFGRRDYPDAKVSKQHVQSRFIIFLDGLDEAGDSIREGLLKCVASLDSRYFQVVITSRPHIEPPATLKSIKLIDIRADSADLTKYIRAQLTLSASLVLAQDDRLAAYLAEKICENSKGLFLHAKHHTLYVTKHASAAKMKEAAEKPFNRLGDIYGEVLKDVRLDKEIVEEEALKTLAWLTYAQHTLDTATLSEALAISLDDNEYNEEKRPQLQQIMRWCRGLAEMDESLELVRLTHQTVADYLKQQEQIRVLQPLLVATCFKRLALENVIRKLEGDSSDEDESDSSDGEIDDDNLSEGAQQDVEESISPRRIDDLKLSNEGILYEDIRHEADLESVTYSEYDDSDFGSVLTSNLAVDLLTWARQNSEFARYASDYGLGHLKALEARQESVIESIWSLFEHRPNSAALRDLLDGENGYHEGCTPLHVAAWLAQPELISRLHEYDLDINITNERGQTPLMYAAMYADQQTVQVLLELSGRPEICDAAGKTALELLAFDPPPTMVTQLIPSDHNFGPGALIRPSRLGLINTVKTLLEKGIGDPQYEDDDGRTPLIHSCSKAHKGLVKELLLHNIDVNVSCKVQGATALHYAIESGDPSIVHLLLRNGADPNQVDHVNEHALLRITWGGRYPERHLAESVALEMLEIILKYKPNLEIKGDNAGTPLWEALNARKYPKMVEALVHAGCDILREYNDITPLQSVARSDPGSKNYKILLNAEKRLAKKNGQKFNAAHPNSSGNTILHTAAAMADPEVVRNVMRLPGIEVNYRNLDGRTPLFVAMHGRGKVHTDMLLEEGAETDVVDNKGNSILDAALTAAPAAVVRKIIERSCSIERPWNLDDPCITRFEAEPWYDRVKCMIDERNLKAGHVGPAASIELQGPHTAYNRDEGALVELEVPEIADSVVASVVFRFSSHDQGWSMYMEESGLTYHSASWFEVGIRRAGKPELESVRTLQHNVHGSSMPRSYYLHWMRDSKDPRDQAWVSSLHPGDRIVVLAQSHGSGWINAVDRFAIELYRN